MVRMCVFGTVLLGFGVLGAIGVLLFAHGLHGHHHAVLVVLLGPTYAVTLVAAIAGGDDLARLLQREILHGLAVLFHVIAEE